MMNEYDHERRERKEPRDIQHIVMPKFDVHTSALMYKYLTNRELSYQTAVINGWYPTVSRGPRVVIPCINTDKFNYWQARALTDHPLRYDSPPIPRKDSIVFLLPIGKALRPQVAITEGPMDALAAAEFMPAIALMGGKPSQEVSDHIKKLTKELGLSKAILIPDQDNFGLLDSFVAQDYVVEARIPTGKDLAEMPRWEREKLLCAF